MDKNENVPDSGNKNAMPMPLIIKEENESVEVIDLDEYKTLEEVSIEWNMKVICYFKYFFCEDTESSLNSVMRWYIQTLKDDAVDQLDDRIMKQAMEKHILFCKLYFKEIDSRFYDNYLENMENILAIYCDVKVRTLPKKRGKDSSVFKKELICLCQRLILFLRAYLLGHDHCVLHVLMKMRLFTETEEAKDFFHSIFSYFVKRKPPSTSDLAFCRIYILCQKWKNVRNSSDWARMDEDMYAAFGRTAASLKTNDTLQRILLPKHNSVLEILAHFNNNYKDLIQRYFDYVRLANVQDLEELETLEITSADEEISSELLRDEDDEDFQRAYGKYARTMEGAKVEYISDTIVLLDDDDNATLENDIKNECDNDNDHDIVTELMEILDSDDDIQCEPVEPEYLRYPITSKEANSSEICKEPIQTTPQQTPVLLPVPTTPLLTPAPSPPPASKIQKRNEIEMSTATSVKEKEVIETSSQTTSTSPSIPVEKVIVQTSGPQSSSSCVGLTLLDDESVLLSKNAVSPSCQNLKKISVTIGTQTEPSDNQEGQSNFTKSLFNMTPPSDQLMDEQIDTVSPVYTNISDLTNKELPSNENTLKKKTEISRANGQINSSSQLKVETASQMLRSPQPSPNSTQRPSSTSHVLNKRVGDLYSPPTSPDISSTLLDENDSFQKRYSQEIPAVSETPNLTNNEDNVTQSNLEAGESPRNTEFEDPLVMDESLSHEDVPVVLTENKIQKKQEVIITEEMSKKVFEVPAPKTDLKNNLDKTESKKIMFTSPAKVDRVSHKHFCQFEDYVNNHTNVFDEILSGPLEKINGLTCSKVTVDKSLDLFANENSSNKDISFAETAVLTTPSSTDMVSPPYEEGLGDFTNFYSVQSNGNGTSPSTTTKEDSDSKFPKKNNVLQKSTIPVLPPRQKLIVFGDNEYDDENLRKPPTRKSTGKPKELKSILKAKKTFSKWLIEKRQMNMESLNYYRVAPNDTCLQSKACVVIERLTDYEIQRWLRVSELSRKVKEARGMRQGTCKPEIVKKVYLDKFNTSDNSVSSTTNFLHVGWRLPPDRKNPIKSEVKKGRRENIKVGKLSKKVDDDESLTTCDQTCCGIIASHFKELEVSNVRLPKTCPKCPLTNNPNVPTSICDGSKEKDTHERSKKQLDDNFIFKKPVVDTSVNLDMNIVSKIAEALSPLPEFGRSFFHVKNMKQPPAMVPGIEELEQMMNDRISTNQTNLNISNLSPSPTLSYFNPSTQSITDCISNMEKIEKSDTNYPEFISEQNINVMMSSIGGVNCSEITNDGLDNTPGNSFGSLSLQSLFHNFNPNDFDLINNSTSDDINVLDEQSINEALINITATENINAEDIMAGTGINQIEFQDEMIDTEHSNLDIPGEVMNIINYSKHLAEQQINTPTSKVNTVTDSKNTKTLTTVHGDFTDKVSLTHRMNAQENVEYAATVIDDCKIKLEQINKYGPINYFENDQVTVPNDANVVFDNTANDDKKLFDGEIMKDYKIMNVLNQGIVYTESGGTETRLPLKKRKLSMVNSKDEDEGFLEQTFIEDIIKRARCENLDNDNISYPADRMISIAEVQEKLTEQQQQTRQFRTPAEKKEMPAPDVPPFQNCPPNVENPPPSSDHIPTHNLYEIPKIVTEQYNNHTYNNPTINYHMNNLPSCFFPCASMSYFPPIILPMSGTTTFDMNVVTKSQQQHSNGNRHSGEATTSRPRRKRKTTGSRTKTDEN